jgi:fermentation-respiration switch protein FrsA (DUF1100 family)
MWATLKKAGRFALMHWLAFGLLVSLVVLLMSPHALERFYVYYPTREVPGDPKMLGLAFEDVVLTTEDGIKLHGWFVPYAEASTTLLIFHGNAGNIGHRLSWIDMLHRLRVNVYIVDYRGYGKSEGKPFEQGLYRDATASYQWWLHERGGTNQKLVLLGESLGGAVAVDLAARFPVSGIILQSTFTSARDMAKSLFPLGLLQPVLGVHFDSASKIRLIACPKLFIHGNRDEIVPFELGKKLFELAPEPKRFFEVPGAGHNDLIWVAEPEYSRRIADFLAALRR